MQGQQFWIKIDGVVRGPVPPSELRELASSGRVSPDTLISLDEVQWSSARTVNGLFEALYPESGAEAQPTGEMGSPSDREPLRREPADGNAKRQIAGSMAPWFPVIRIRQRLLRFEVVAIYETHVLMGTHFGGSVPVTEEMCHPAGEPALRRLLSLTKRMEFADISIIRYESPKKPKRSKAGQQPKGLCSFELLSKDRRRVRFSVPVSQAGSVRAVLFSTLGDDYLSRTVRRRRLAGVALICLSTLFFWLGAAYVDVHAELVSAIAVAWWITLFVVGLYVYANGVTRGRWTQRGEIPTGTVPQDLPQRKAVLRARLPFRSRWLGWTLKLLGIAYWVLIASPLTDPLQDSIKGGQRWIWIWIWAPAPLLIYAGYQLCQRRYEPSQRSDTRKPILFLRPFEDDSTTSLQPPGIVSALSGVSSRWNLPQWVKLEVEGGRIRLRDLLLRNHPVQLLRMVFDYGVGTSEESVVRYFEKFGPVVAIGKPGERLVTPGASRVYVEDARWKETVTTELTRSQAVVVQPGFSAGVQWELEEIRARVDPHRVLLCLWADKGT